MIILTGVFSGSFELRSPLIQGRHDPSLTLINDLSAGNPVSSSIVLESVLGTSAEMWVRMQAEHDLWVARRTLPDT